MKLIYIVIFCLSIQGIQGQVKPSKLALMQGIWSNIMNDDTSKAFSIISKNRSLNFVFSNSSDLGFPLDESIEGFQNIDLEEVDSLNINLLQEDGLFYVTAEIGSVSDQGWVYRPNYFTPKYFECDGANMSINGGKLVEFVKIDKLPNKALLKLYYRGKSDNRNYIKDYLNIQVNIVTSKECIVYSEVSKPTTVGLSKGDIVTVLENKKSWLKVMYGDDGKIGWIKRVDVK
jgi:hypothetical protein